MLVVNRPPYKSRSVSPTFGFITENLRKVIPPVKSHVLHPIYVRYVPAHEMLLIAPQAPAQQEPNYTQSLGMHS